MEVTQTPAPETELGPARISFASFLLKLLAGGAGGSMGALILLVIFVLASSVMAPLTGDSETPVAVSPIFTFLLMTMVFLSSTIGNIVSVWLLSLTEKGKYTRTSSTIYQTFIISIIIFLLMVPVYFIASAIDPTYAGYAVALHVLLSAQAAALIMEIISNYRYALVGLYGSTFSVLLSAMVMFGLAGILQSPRLLLFLALPIVWLSMAFVQSVTTSLYGWIARTYDKDFLSTQTVYGNDYGKEVEDTTDTSTQKVATDEAGADFLRHN